MRHAPFQRSRDRRQTPAALNEVCFEVFDPRQGQDCKFGPLRDGSVVSSRDRHLSVVQVAPAFWLKASSRVWGGVLSCLQTNGGTGFACAFAIPKQIEDSLPGETQRERQGSLSHFAATPDGFRSAFGLFKGLEYGELTVGRWVDELGCGHLGAKAGTGPLRGRV